MSGTSSGESKTMADGFSTVTFTSDWLKKGRMINVGVDVWEGYPASEQQIWNVIQDEREDIHRRWV